MKRIPALVIALLLPFLSQPGLGQEVITLTESFNASGGVAVDANGDIYVADFGILLTNSNGTRVYKVLRDGTVSIFAEGLQGASGNEFDEMGNLFQSNIGGNSVSKITPDGQVSTFASQNIIAPVGCAIDSAGNVYVTNCLNGPGRIMKISPEGETEIFVDNPILRCPNGLTIDDAGNLYTCNFGNGDVIKITPDGTPTTLTTIPGGNNGHLTFANNMLYVVARCANQIYRVSLNGGVSLLAGTGARGNQDGPALQATFSIPNGIAASPDGDTLYINDAVPTALQCVNSPLNPIVVRIIVGVKDGTTSVGDNSVPRPERFSLHQNYPNPFNPSTSIRYDLPDAGNVVLTVHNQLGQTIRTLVDAYQSTGLKSVVWDGRDSTGSLVSSGTYICKIVVGGFVESMKMTLVK